MRLVLDTCVLVAAMRSPKGASRAVLNAALDGLFEFVLSTAMVLEYESVLTRNEQIAASGVSTKDVGTLLDTLCELCIEAVSDWQWRPQLRDADDELVLEAAVNGHADAIVTFNRSDFLPGSQQFGIEVLTPGEALARMSRYEKE